MYHLSESDKHFALAMIGATGVILFWKGIWEGIGSLPIIENVWVSLFVGLVILTFSGILFKEFDVLGGLDKSITRTLHFVHSHPQRHQFTIQYYDKLQKKEKEIKAQDIIQIEKGTLAVHENGREIFLPFHRIRSVKKNSTIFWKL